MPRARVVDEVDSIPHFTERELSDALCQLKTKRAPDAQGISAEMLKEGGDTFKRVLLETLNNILRSGSPTPSSRKHTVIKVLHKSGDPMRLENYRPIASIPMLYKLFSKLLCNRLGDTLDDQQSVLRIS